MKTCPYCGSQRTVYIGVSDGLGDFGTSLCDMYECEDCGDQFEADCIDTLADLTSDRADVQ